MTNLSHFDRRAFLERLMARLHLLLDQKVKADILILVGRRDKVTEEELPPRVQIHEHDL